jgi:hypothetical protein
MTLATTTRRPRAARVSVLAALILFAASPALAQLNEHCTVSILNRTVQVNPDGSWVLPNVPAGTGQVRARATCVENGITRSGESDLFTITPNRMNAIPPIRFGTLSPIPVALTITPAPTPVLSAPEETLQLTVTALYPGGTSRDVSGAASGTNYTISNPAIATIGPGGLVTAKANGTVVIQAINEGAPGMATLRVLFATTTTDSDADGIPDADEIALGLDPQNPTDALDDPDRDGLTTLDEYQRGTDPKKNDTDSDGLSDGAEVAGSGGFVTNPLLRDTDGDGISDGVETSTGSNPLDPGSTNIPGALSSLTVSPAVFGLSFNTIAGDASVQLTVTGTLIDGSTLTLTSGRGVNYSSSDLDVCNFGAAEGRVFAGTDGTCVVTATLGARSAAAHGSVRTFAPTPLGFVDVPGSTSVDVSGNFAFVAAGSEGLQVVDVAARTAPAVIASLALAGHASDVKVVGSRAFVAAGSAGLHVVDITDPAAPVRLSTIDTPGEAMDVRVYGDRAYVADGSSGLQIISVSQSQIIGAVQTDGANGVDVSGSLAVVAGNRLQIVDVTDPAAPVIVGNLDTLPDTPRDVVVNGTIAYVADYTGSMQIVDFGTPNTPTVVGRTNQDQSVGGVLEDVAFAGPYAFGADIFFVNGVPIVDVSTPSSPQTRAILDFSNFRDDDGNGIAVDANYVYLTTHQGRLYIGQYLAIDDNGGVAPTVALTSPAPDTTYVEGEQITLTATADDDVAVAAVNFTIDGVVVFTDSTAPYEFTATAPIGASRLTLSAIGVDFGGNFANAPNVAVDVIPDPLTTVVGSVVDADGQPVAGAAVTVAGRTGTTGSDGAFSIADVPTIQQSLVVGVSLARDGETLSGSARATAVRGGITDAGVIVVKATAFEEDIGTFEPRCRWCDVTKTLPFAFPIGGTTVDEININNGYLWTGRGDFFEVFCCNLGGGGGGEGEPTLQAQVLATDDPAPGLYINDQLPGRFVVTWFKEDSSFGGPNTVQAILFDDGRIQYAYNGIAAGASTQVGLFPANAQTSREVDFSASPDLRQGATEAVYEDFYLPEKPFDLDGGFVVFTPHADGGYDIRPVPDATLPVCSVTNPVNGATLFEGERLFIEGSASDNGALQRVSVRSSDGSLDVADAGTPFREPFVVPVGLSTVTFTVTAYDGWNNAGTCTSTNPVIPGPPPTVAIVSPTVVTAGASIPISIDANNRVPVASVELRVNGVALATDTTAPFEFLFTVPSGVSALAIGAVATDTVGKTGTAANVDASVIADPLTSVQGRVVDPSLAPVSGAQVHARLHGVALEIFDLAAPVTQFSELPSLDTLTPRTTVVSSINLRNPGGLFGVDPFGIGTGSHATRFTARLETVGQTEYTFTLGVNAGGRLRVNGYLVVDLPTSTGGFQTGTGTWTGGSGSGPLEIEIVAFDNGNPEVQLWYGPSADTLEVPGTEEWTQTRVPPPGATTGGDGTFVIPNVPTVLGDVIVDASAPISGRTARGSSEPIAPVPGQATDVGDIRLRGGRVLLLSAHDEANTARSSIAAAGVIPAEDIDTLDVRSTTPTLTQLQAYGAVLVFSNYPFQNAVAMGDVLADYVDAGGGVVTASFSHFSQPFGLLGRLTSAGYAAFVSGGQVGSHTLSLANSNTAHPIMQGVTEANLSFQYTDYTGYSLAAGATAIARDTSNHPKVAVNPSGRVVGIAIFPGFGLSADLGRLFANAIDFVR